MHMVGVENSLWDRWVAHDIRVSKKNVEIIALEKLKIFSLLINTKEELSTKQKFRALIPSTRGRLVSTVKETFVTNLGHTFFLGKFLGILDFFPWSCKQLIWLDSKYIKQG